MRARSLASSLARLATGLGLALALGSASSSALAAPADPGGAAPAPAPEGQDELEGQAELETETELETEDRAPSAATSSALSRAQLIDTVLPCGLRVIAAQDASLPVASVVLAVEVGTRDDPDKLPGLVHALAYHLQQGNRELAPGEAISTAHDVGGLAGMAVGAAQVRFETLLPLSQLDAQLRVESQRLRAPTIRRELWLKSLSYASSDEQLKPLLPSEAAALVWEDPGMAHDGRRVSKALGDMLDQAVGAQLMRLFDYRHATLVVVSPEPPADTLARVEPGFADLPARPRQVLSTPQTPPAPTHTGGGPRSAELARQKGDSLVWAVRGEPLARAWAQVLCGTINRQARGQDDPARAQVRCTYADDPRRPLLVLRAIGFDAAAGPEALIASRLERIAALAEQPTLEPELSALIEGQRARIESQLHYQLRTSLGLAVYLSSSAAEPPSARDLPVLADSVGLPLLDPSLPAPPAAPAPPDAGARDEQPPADAGPPAGPVDGRAATSLAAAIPELLDTRRALLLLDEGQAAPPPATPAPKPELGPIEAARVPAEGPAPEPDPAPRPEPAPEPAAEEGPQ